MSFLVSIGMWLLKLATSEVVMKYIKSVFQDMLDEGKEYLPIALAAVRTAAGRTDLDAKGKFELATRLLKESFPDISSSLMNSIIENAYRMFQKDG
jgi:hypothetical protein